MRACIDVGRVMKRQRQREVALPEPDSLSHGRADDPDDQALETSIVRKLTAEQLRAAIERLPIKPRTAVWLHWVKGLPVESQDAKEWTVSRAMDVTARMVRNYLAQGLRTLRSDPAVADLRDSVGSPADVEGQELYPANRGAHGR